MTDVFLYTGEPSPNDVKLRDPTAVSGRVDYTLTCAAGSYAYTGQAATLAVGRNLALAAGSYAYAGSAATLKVARNLSLAAGAYSYAGNDATLTYTPGATKVDYTLACAPGAYSLAGSPSELLYVPGQTKQGGVSRLNLRASFRGIETEEQKRLRREAQGIIQRIQKAQPEQVVALQDEADAIGKELQDAISRLELAADAYEQAMKAKQAQKARRDAEALQAMLIEAQLQTELLQQQAEELDVIWLTFAIAAHL